MKKALMLLLTTAALGGCSVLPGSREDRSGTPTSGEGALPGLSQRPEANQCLNDLGRAGVRFDALPDRYLGQGCSNLNTVQMHALASDTGRLEVTNLGPVTCPVSAAFAAWARYGVDRAAQQVFGARLASIQTMGSFACRNVAGSGRRSAHASADAIDVGGFVLADGRRISVADGWNGDSREREFLRIVQRSACRRFDVVLGPDYNAAHRDHLHLEAVIEGESYCR
ncbi:extensin family protein [Aurantiacibacter poecillastricola]|uniref:extensin family protein n=1 Tax=Aurantiacibacter poecillastricola TaxID=3064385 RepID=UPI00273E2426|nr:extensin family protein [Aurantiacibacter sp. 219JJ12-13]MDP5261451.1 extensin family protein [Aurantiacibacter sp. 219JJ12-13]